MSFKSFILTTLLFATGSVAAPADKRSTGVTVVQGNLGIDSYWNEHDGGTNSYQLFTGDGSHEAGWPDNSHWVSFNDMWTTNLHLIERSCDEIYHVANNNRQEIQDLHDMINQVSHETRVDHRFILAMILQETQGCVRAATDNFPDGTKNTGVLKSLNGGSTCNEAGKVTNPCPRDNILGQIRDGIEGTAQGHGCAEDINEQASFVNGNQAQAYYRAARLYDSGMIDSGNDLGKSTAGEKCYSSDVANRLMGWTDSEYTCDLDK